MQLESRTPEELVFAPWNKSKRVRSFLGGLGLVLIGLLSLILAAFIVLGVIPSHSDMSTRHLMGPIAVGVIFPVAGLRNIFNAMPLRLVVRRGLPTSFLMWGSWKFCTTQLSHVDAVAIGTQRTGRSGAARRFVLYLRSGSQKTRIVRSFDYWWSDAAAALRARHMAKEIASFLACRVEIVRPTRCGLTGHCTRPGTTS